MKSVAIQFMADLGLWVQLIFFWSLALGFGFLARTLFKRGWKLFAAPLMLATAALLVLPFWSRTGGRILAQDLCSDIGGPHAFVPLPARADSIRYEGRQPLWPSVLSELLLRDGFAYVEHVDTGKLKAWRIEPASHGRCPYEEVGVGDYIWFHEHGMREDECLVHTEQPTPRAAITYSEEEEVRKSPVPVKVSHRRVADATGAPVWTHSSFIYYPVSPYSSNGGEQAVRCHWIMPDDPDPFEDQRAEFVSGTGAPRRGPGPAVTPASLTSTRTQLLSMQRIEGGTGASLDDQQFMGHYRAVMDLRAGGPRTWLPFPTAPTGGTRISFGEGTEEAGAVAVPDFEGRRFGEVEVRAAKLQDGHLFLLRYHSGEWELSDYDITTRAWRRNYVGLSYNDARPIVRKGNSLHPVLTAFEIGADRIVVRGLAMRSGVTGMVDSGFELAFRRP